MALERRASLKYAIVTHTDIDGVSSAALYSYVCCDSAPKRVNFVEPYLLHSLASELAKSRDVDKIVFMDLGLNKNAFTSLLNALERLAKSSVLVEWYDHHVWEKEWIEKFEELGVKLFIDRGTCTVGLVAKHAPRGREVDDSFVRELVSGVCGADLFKFDHKLSPWFHRLVSRRDSDEWREYVFERISSGTLWCPEFTNRVVERFNREIEEYRSADELIEIREFRGLRIGIVMSSEHVDSSLLASYALSRYSLDVAVVSSVDGKLSMRSVEYNVRELAYALGGGGHPRAAGAKIRIPLAVKLKALVNKSLMLKYVADKVINAIDELGGLGKL